MTRLTSASRQLIRNITTATPTMLRTLEIKLVTLSSSTLLMFSTSLVSRLISSPCERWSK